MNPRSWLWAALLCLGACEAAIEEGTCDEVSECRVAEQVAAAADTPEGSRADAPDAQAPAASSAWRTRSLAIDAYALVPDVTRGRVYAAVGGRPGPYANQLLTLDGATGAVLAAVHVGSDPVSITSADDGSMLWVALAGAQAVRRVDLTTPMPTPAEQYSAPPLERGERASPTSVVALAGQPRSVLVTLGSAFSGERMRGVVILDDGVERRLASRQSWRASLYVAGPAGTVFGYNAQSTGYEFEVVTLGADTRTHATQYGLISGFISDIYYAGNHVFASSGEVVDVRDPSTPVRSGKFAVAGAYVQPVDAASPVVLTTAGPGYGDQLRVHFLDTATTTVQRTVELKAAAHVDGVAAAAQAVPGAIVYLGRSWSGSRVGGTLHLLSRDDGRALRDP